MCRCGLGPCWMCSGGTDVSNKPRKSYTVTLYPSHARKEHVNKDLQLSPRCFPTLSGAGAAKQVGHIGGEEVRVLHGSGSLSLTPSGKLLFLRMAGTRPRHPLVPQGQKMPDQLLNSFKSATGQDSPGWCLGDGKTEL